MGETVQSLVAQAGGASGLLGMLPFLVGMFVIMYFLMIRPERKKQAEAQTMLSALKKGDEVVLTSGIVGKIHALDAKTVSIDIADKTRIKVLKVAVMGPAARYLATPEELKKLDDKRATKDAAKDADTSAAPPSGNPTPVSDDVSDKKSA